jgi:hypothetical protein
MPFPPSSRPSTSGILEAAAGAVERLGDALVPTMDALLDEAGSPASPLVMRLVR